jgi:hypothetical protein
MEKLTMSQVRDLLYRAAESLDESPKRSDIELVNEIDAALKHIDSNFVVVYYP